jgi:hypothetical protein
MKRASVLSSGKGFPSRFDNGSELKQTRQGVKGWTYLNVQLIIEDDSNIRMG